MLHASATQVAPAFQAPPGLLASEAGPQSEIDRKAGTLAAIAASDTVQFGTQLITSIGIKGICLKRAIVMAVMPDNSIGVVGAHPDKLKLERLFIEDGELFHQFHMVTRQNDMVASAEICRRYLLDSYNAQGEHNRMAVWRRYRALCDQMESLAGRLTLASGRLLSGALEFTASALEQGA